MIDENEVALKNPYFVMMFDPDDGYFPLSEADNVMRFATEPAAIEYTKNTAQAELFGFQVFKIDLTKKQFGDY